MKEHEAHEEYSKYTKANIIMLVNYTNQGKLTQSAIATILRWNTVKRLTKTLIRLKDGQAGQ